MIYAKSIVVLSASQGARVGSAIYDDNSLSAFEKDEKIRNTALTILSNGLTGEDREVTITKNGDELKVKSKYTYHIPVPLVSLLFGNKDIEIEYTAIYLIL
jgi:hypothetical protein